MVFNSLALVPLSQCQVNAETGAPEDELTPETVEFCKKLGSSSTLVSHISGGRDRLIHTAIQEGINCVNEKATSNAQRIQKFTVLEQDFSIPGGELGESRAGRFPVLQYSPWTSHQFRETDRCIMKFQVSSSRRTYKLILDKKTMHVKLKPMPLLMFNVCLSLSGPTMKLKRPVVMKMYKEQIENFYKEVVTPSTPDNPLPSK